MPERSDGSKWCLKCYCVKFSPWRLVSKWTSILSMWFTPWRKSMRNLLVNKCVCSNCIGTSICTLLWVILFTSYIHTHTILVLTGYFVTQWLFNVINIISAHCEGSCSTVCMLLCCGPVVQAVKVDRAVSLVGRWGWGGQWKPVWITREECCGLPGVSAPREESHFTHSCLGICHMHWLLEILYGKGLVKTWLKRDIWSYADSNSV